MVRVGNDGRVCKKTRDFHVLHSATATKGKGFGFRSFAPLSAPQCLGHSQTLWSHSLHIHQDNQWAQNNKVLEQWAGSEDREVGLVALGIHATALARHKLSFRPLVTAVSKAEPSPGSSFSCGTKHKPLVEETLLTGRERKQEPADDLLLCSS